MNQRFFLQVVVDERRNDAGFCQAQPNGHVFGSVLQHQSHRVARLEASVFEDVCYLVGQLVYLQSQVAHGQRRLADGDDTSSCPPA